MTTPKVHVKKGDKVMVIAGKDAGKQGKIVKVIPSKQRVVVEGVNIVKRHTKPNQKQAQGGIMEIPAPLHSSNVMPMCGKCNRPVRVGHKILDSGNKVRYCKICGEFLDK